MLVRPPIGWFQLYIFAGLTVATIATATSGYQYIGDDSFANGYGFFLGAHHLIMYSMFASALLSVAKRQSRSLTMMMIPTGVMIATYVGVLAWELLRGEALPNIFSSYGMTSFAQAFLAAVPPAVEIFLLRRYFARFDRLRMAADLSD